MILLSSKKAEKALAEQSMDNWAKAKYIFVVALLGFFSINGYFIGPRYESTYGYKHFFFITLPLSLICGLLSILITYYGIKKCFKTNESRGGKSFIERFVILAVPIMIKLIIVVIPASLILLGTIGAIWVTHRYEWYDIYCGPFIHLVLTCVFYYYLNRSFKRLARLVQEREEKAEEVMDSLNRYREAIRKD